MGMDFKIKVQNFIERTAPQSDDEFLQTCEIFGKCVNRETTLKVRKIIADLAEINTQYIRAEAKFEDFGDLPFWADCGDVDFDSPLLVKRIKENIPINDVNLDFIPDPDLHTEMTVGEFVRSICLRLS